MEREKGIMHPLILLFVSIPFVIASNPKRGLAFAESSGNDIAIAENALTSWIYDWANSPSSYLENTGMTYIPMQWGAGGIEDFQSTVLSQGASTILVRLLCGFVC